MKAERAAAVTLAALLTLAGCGNSGDQAAEPMAETTSSAGSASGSASTSMEAHNDADVQFAQGMIVHHRGAIEMAGLAADRAGSGEVKELAERIEAAQEPEIETMSGWLEAWGEDVPAEDGGGDGGHGGHGGGAEDSEAMPGMMTAEQMDQLESASGAAFDKMFLEMMVEHHEGAVEMADTELSRGENTEAKELARKIKTDQEREIAEMRGLLQQV